MTTAGRARALVIGASGQLGRRLARDLAASVAVTRAAHTRAGEDALPLDITDERAVLALLASVDPEVVVLAAALTNVAYCEAHPDRSSAVNVEGARNVAAGCRDRTLVFFSSDAVFDGSRPAFREEDAPGPLTVYGRHKHRAEELVRRVPRHLVLRSARFYSRERGDGKFVDQVIARLARHETVEAPLDTPGNPTSVEDLSAATLALLAKGRTGTWHLAGPRVASLHETARIVAQVFGFDAQLVIPVARDHACAVPRITSVLDTGKARGEGIRFRELREGLARIRDGD